MKVNTCLNLDNELLEWYINKYGRGMLSMFVNTQLEKSITKNIEIVKKDFNGINVHINVSIEVTIYKGFLVKNGKGKISIFINHFLNELKNEQKETATKKENNQKETIIPKIKAKKETATKKENNQKETIIPKIKAKKEAINT